MQFAIRYMGCLWFHWCTQFTTLCVRNFENNMFVRSSYKHVLTLQSCCRLVIKHIRHPGHPYPDDKNNLIEYNKQIIIITITILITMKQCYYNNNPTYKNKRSYSNNPDYNNEIKKIKFYSSISLTFYQECSSPYLIQTGQS